MPSPDRHFANAAIFTKGTGLQPNSGDLSLYAKSDDKFYLKTSGNTEVAIVSGSLPFELMLVCSDETTNLTTGTAKITFRMPFAVTLSSVRASLTAAATGANLIVDINEAGASILSTKLSIDDGETTSTTAATPPVISDTALANDAEMTIDIDQIGSTNAGNGLKVWLIGTRA